MPRRARGPKVRMQSPPRARFRDVRGVPGEEPRLLLPAGREFDPQDWRRKRSDARLTFRTVPEIRQLGIRISQNERLARSVGLVHGSSNGSDVSPVDMDARGWPIVKGVRDSMEIANRR